MSHPPANPPNLPGELREVLAIRDARKRFGPTIALAGASFALQEQEWLGLLGPNGAGKTTLVRAITGRVRLDQGTVLLAGTPVSAASSARHRLLGVVSQEIALYPQLTARENLRAFGELCGVTGQQLGRKLDWALEWTGLAERADDRVKHFSGGMQRRLNIACGVLHSPQVILLDEPTAGVDPQSRQRIWEMLSELRDEGAALLFTTHQLDEAESLCDRIVIIDHGETLVAGTFEELLLRTIGTQREVIMELDGSIPASLRNKATFVTGDSRFGWQVENVVRDLPYLLEKVSSSGRHVVDLAIEKPTLQAVFLHLTGRELRE